jgi:hypothetical protein
MDVILSNDFHVTAVKLRVRGGMLSHRQSAAVRRALCGLHDCKCGIVRGPQECGIRAQETGDGLWEIVSDSS